MKTFPVEQVQAAQDHRPQIERFITATGVYVIETLSDYASLPDEIRTLIELRNSIG